MILRSLRNQERNLSSEDHHRGLCQPGLRHLPRPLSKRGLTGPGPGATWTREPPPAGAQGHARARPAPRACSLRPPRGARSARPPCRCPTQPASPRRLSRSRALPSPSLCPVVWGRSACHWFLFTDRGFSESQKDPRPHFLKASCPQPAPPAAQGPGGAGAGQAEPRLSPGGSARGHRACKHLLPAASPASARHPKVGPDH